MRRPWLALAIAWALSAQQPTASEAQADLNQDHREALRQYAAKDYRSAAESFRKAMASESAGSAAYGQSILLLGQSLYLMGRYEEAIDALKRAPRTSETL